jgi:glycosyltransferase involved in cell wall biosynthesis
LADYIQEKYKGNHKIIIDFYGPIKKEEEDYFKGELKKYNFVSYKWILEPDQIHSTLENYDLLILPSRYSEEGFPGTIIDAYISGIPVITSNWRFLSESVDDKLSGFIFDLDKETDFYYYVDYLYSDRTQLQKMKHFAYEKSKEYSSEVAWQILKNYLFADNM